MSVRRALELVGAGAATVPRAMQHAGRSSWAGARVWIDTVTLASSPQSLADLGTNPSGAPGGISASSRVLSSNERTTRCACCITHQRT
jgi:hypothetical protein